MTRPQKNSMKNFERPLKRVDGVVENLRIEYASAGAEIGMDFFACSVDGLELRGAFHKVEFHDGDYIEFVVEPEGEFSTVHAARNPGTRMLWMPPHQVRGHAAQKLCDIRWSFLYPTAAVALVGISEFFVDPDFGAHAFSAELLFYSLVFFVTLAITVMIRLRFKGFARQTTEVLRAFGYEHPEMVDLWQLHKQAQKVLAGATNTLPPLVTPWSYRYSDQQSKTTLSTGMTDDDRRKIFWYLKRKTSYTAWSREAKIFDRFADVFAKQVREQPIVAGSMFEANWTPFLSMVVKAQASYEQALDRLRQGDRTVFLQNSRGAMVDATILSEHWYVELINNGPRGDHTYSGKYVPAMEDLMREFVLAVADRGYLQPRMADTPAPEAWDSFWPALYAQLPLPAQLDDVPLPAGETVVRSGTEVPVFGIYEPHIQDGCMNYLLGGTPAPTLWETDGAGSTGNALSVNWRLIWEDCRYRDGTIPAEERLYFSLAAQAGIGCGFK